MPILQVIGDQPAVGKTCLAGALLSSLAARGKRVAYARPFSANPQADPDVAFMAGYLAQLQPGAPPPPAPQAVSPSGLSQQMADAVARLESRTDVVLVEGPDLASADGQPSPLAEQAAARLNSKVVLVFRYSNALTAAQVKAVSTAFGPRLAGVVINGVTKHRMHQTQQGLLAELQALGVPVLGALPEDRAMLAVTVQQIAAHLGGRYVEAPEHADALVERFLIGGNIMDSGAIYFGRLSNQAVITRAARPDIQLASLTPNTRCLVLTGGGEPTEYIQVEARQRGVPLVLVDTDTLATAEALGGLLAWANPCNPQKLERFRQLMQERLELGGLGLDLG
ncbi:MAG: phosphotransacetylase family protein [SAR202 cluster bacterium]|nr:phosphotransacetylase family protein [SAR202 cluster bacterium]